MAARRRKCLQVVDKLTSVFTGWTQKLTSVCQTLQESLPEPSSLLAPVLNVSDPALRLAKSWQKKDFCDECDRQMAEMTSVGTSVDPPTQEEIQEEQVAYDERELRERLILQALLQPEINNDRMFPRLVTGPRPLDPPSPQRNLDYNYLHVRYPMVTGLRPIPGSDNPVASIEDGDRHMATTDDIDINLQERSLEVAILPQQAASPSGEVVMRHVEEEFGQMIPDHSKNSHSFGYIRPTYKETFGSFGVTSMCSVPAIHLQYKDNHCNDSPRYFTCRQIVARCERVPVPLGFAWKWLETNRICFCDEDMLGVGTFSTVVFAHITEYDSGSITLTGAAMKIYNRAHVDLNVVMMEADISSYMAAIGVGPVVLGLARPIPERELLLPSLLTQYMPGAEDLFTLFNGHSKPPRLQSLDLLVQTARLLTVIHNHGFLHNDIKLNNVIAIPNPLRVKGRSAGVEAPVGASGHLTAFSQYRVYLIDFGVSTYHRGARYAMTQTDLQEFYRFPYLPPEVLMEGGTTTTASDVYSFGMLLQQASNLLGDDKLAYDLFSIINQCTSDPSERPLMAIVERQLLAKMPKLQYRWRLKLRNPRRNIRISSSEAKGLRAKIDQNEKNPSSSVLPSM